MRFRVMFSLLVLLQALSLSALADTHTSTGFYYPLKSDSFRTERGFWLNPATGYTRPGIAGSYVKKDTFHAAVDMMASSGTDVVAIADGEVSWHSLNGWSDLDENGKDKKDNIAIIIRHMKPNGDYFCSLSGHVKKSGAKQPGEIVKAGEWIGDVGVYNIGGDHLHFAIYDSDDPNCALSQFGTSPMTNWPTDWTGQKLQDEGKSTKLGNFVDPIWFITHNAPNNWVSRDGISPSNPISVTNPWFTQLCIESSPMDSRCDASIALLAWECIYEGLDLCTPEDGLPYWHSHSTRYNGNRGGGQGNEPDPVNLQLDFDIQVPGSKEEIYAGKDYLLENQTVRLNLVLEVEEGDAEFWMKDNKEKVETDVYVRYDNGEWTRAGREYSEATSLTEGDRHEEHVLLTIPEGVSTVSFYAETDAESELNETEEGDNVSRIETFEVSHLLPNYTVSDVFFSDPNTGARYYNGAALLEDQYWYPYCEIASIGETNAPIAVEVSHRMDGSERDTDTLATDDISVGSFATETVWSKWKLGDTGTRTYTCCVDSRNQLPELNEGDNCKSATYNVVPYKSDLIVSDLYLKRGSSVIRNGGSLWEDDTVKPHCVAKNIGNRTLQNGIRLKYEVNSGTYRGDDGLDAQDLPVGAQKTEYMSDGFRLGNTGNRTYRCCVDYRGNEKELNEGNNCRTMSFTVKPRKPDFVISDLWLVDERGNVIKGGVQGKRKRKFHPQCVVKNGGNADSPRGIRIKYYINANKYRDDDGIDAHQLQRGESRHEYVSNDNIYLGDGGWRTYRCCADTDNRVSELNEGNNCRTYRFYLR